MTSVLLADDHSFLRAGVEAVLRGTRFKLVATASRGDEALAEIAKHDPDICILDIRMPGGSGVEVLEQMRSEGDERPVVLLTAEMEDHALIAAVRSGVNGIVLKEGAADSLVGCLEQVEGGRRAIPPELLQHALDLSLRTEPSDPLSQLTPRERQIAELVSHGLRNRDIAARLGVTEGTVKVYLHSVYQKIGVENRTELALIARGKLSRSETVNVR